MRPRICKFLIDVPIVFAPCLGTWQEAGQQEDSNDLGRSHAGYRGETSDWATETSGDRLRIENKQRG